MINKQEEQEEDVFNGLTELDCVQFLLADMHADLSGRVMRLRYLSDLGSDLGPSGTMIFGGYTTYTAWVEAKSSFVNGNYFSVVVACQALIENILAAVLYTSLQTGSLPKRVHFKETLKRSLSAQLINAQDHRDLERLLSLRNPLSHFRDVNDVQNLDRRSMQTMTHPNELLQQDAWFAIGIVTRILSKNPFRVGV